MSNVLSWIEANPITTLAVVVWVIANFAPRPHPEDCTGSRKVFWQVMDRLCILTAKAFPGMLKLPFSDSPSQPKVHPAPLRTEAEQVNPETSKDDDGIVVEVAETTEEVDAAAEGSHEDKAHE